MVMRLLCCLLLITATPLWALTQLQASVDKNPVLAGEFFILNITADDTIKAEKPDTSALLKDFVVGPTSVSTSTNIINGSISKQTTWSVKLMTRSANNYTIPAFTIAGVSSDPIELKVTERSKDVDQDNDIFIQSSISSESLYVQEAGLYTVKLYLAKELLDGNLSNPSMPDAQLRQIGKQQEGYELVNGKRYLVITREYLVQPQKSGQFTLKAPEFQGRIRQNYRQMEVSALGDNVDIEIKPIPSDYQGAWLPSELVNIDEQYQPKDDSVDVGTPITRTITLTALGVTKEQLPEINLPKINGIRSYPDNQETSHLVRDNRVISKQVASYALLPQKPGTYTLPEIKVPWFNTKINRVNYATLPARTITVTGSTQAAISKPISAQHDSIETPPTASAPAVHTKTQTRPPLWLIIASILGYLLWLTTLILWWQSKKHSSVTEKSTAQPIKGNLASLETLKKLCKSNDLSAFHTELTHYAQQYTKQSNNAIDSLAQQIDNEQLTSQIANLRAELYSSSNTDVDLTLIVTILENQQKNKINSQQAVLKGLYN
ncbi:MAG: BatD family protein [Pseudoalteromonas sp.]|uniref:BatD family protein n=1 Tax=unclassified Pseudoalteromonas TaxID=194690 RepID=UPI003F9B7369